MRYILLLTWAAMVIASAAAGAITEEDLVGTWDWQRTTLGFAGEQTPETEGYDQVLVFAADGTFEWLRDEAVYWSGNWALSDQTSPCGTAQTLFIDTLTPSTPQAVYFSGESLVFGVGCVDGADYYFVRRSAVSADASTWSRLKVSAVGRMPASRD